MSIHSHEKYCKNQSLKICSLSVVVLEVHILTHTSNAKCFRNATLINIRGLAENILQFLMMRPKTCLHPFNFNNILYIQYITEL